jgi:hypothetical protein
VAKRVPSLPPYWQEFLSCLFLHIALPLVPLAFEYAATGRIRSSSAHIVGSLYAISMGVSSRNRLLFGAGIVVGVLLAALFGSIVASEEAAAAPDDISLPLITIGFLVIMHIAERYNRHVVDRAPYWEF